MTMFFVVSFVGFVFLVPSQVIGWEGRLQNDLFCDVVFCSLAVLDPRVGHTMDVLSPFFSVLCHCG